MEHVQLLHLVSSILSGYVFVLSAWWWLVEGDPSPGYKWVCLIMLGICLSSLASFIVLYRVSHGDILDTVYDCDEMYEWFVYFRQYLVVIPLAGYSVHITKRILNGDVTGSKYSGPERRKKI